MSVSSRWRSSGSFVVGPRGYVKISRNRVGCYVKSYVMAWFYGVRVSNIDSRTS